MADVLAANDVKAKKKEKKKIITGVLEASGGGGPPGISNSCILTTGIAWLRRTSLPLIVSPHDGGPIYRKLVI
jgi:hypothetical protein